jgi:hypothetical protein
VTAREDRTVGTRPLATQDPLTVAGVKGDGRRLEGEVACLQVYDKALTDEEIEGFHDCPVGEWSGIGIVLHE